MQGQVNPEMVTLGRLSRGLTQEELGSKISATQGTISRIESGVLPIEADQLQAIATALDYPPHFFFERAGLDGPGMAELFHERRRKTVRAMSLNRAYATATIRRIHIQKLLVARQADEGLFPLYPRDEFGDPAQVARTVRAHLNLPVGPVFNLTEAVEAVGAIVVACDFESRLIDGFSRWRRPSLPPLFFLNRHSPPDRWRWTLAHELGHIVMHTMQTSYPEMEEEADSFAEEFLMPSNVIRSQLLNLSFHTLSGLKTHWKVSIQALIMRAFHLNLISPRQRSYMFMQWSRAGYRLREPEELDPPAETPGALTRLVEYHLSDLGYSVSDLSAALALKEHEFRITYLPEYSGFKVLGGTT